VTRERLETLRAADWVVIDEVKRSVRADGHVDLDEVVGEEQGPFGHEGNAGRCVAEGEYPGTKVTAAVGAAGAETHPRTTTSRVDVHLDLGAAHR